MISINEKEFMFEQKYRPQTIEECILAKADKEIFLQIVKEGYIPHLILQSDSPGTGKTTVARALCNDTNSNVLFVNGSDCKIDYIRDELTAFASSSSLDGGRKVVIIDEFDRAGLGESQKHLRSFMEAYSNNCSIIMTANNLEGIISPLRSRARVIKFGEPTKEDRQEMMKAMIKRCTEICANENIKIEDLKVIATLVKKNFPDFRKVVNDLDMYSKRGIIDSGILSLVNNTNANVDEVIEALKKKQVSKLRELAIAHSNNYKAFIERLNSSMYPELTNASIVRMYQIIGESNQYFGLAASIEIHITYLLLQLAVEMVWKD